MPNELGDAAIYFDGDEFKTFHKIPPHLLSAIANNWEILTRHAAKYVRHRHSRNVCCQRLCQSNWGVLGLRLEAYCLGQMCALCRRCPIFDCFTTEECCKVEAFLDNRKDVVILLDGGVLAGAPIAEIVDNVVGVIAAATGIRLSRCTKKCLFALATRQRRFKAECEAHQKQANEIALRNASALIEAESAVNVPKSPRNVHRKSKGCKGKTGTPPPQQPAVGEDQSDATECVVCMASMRTHIATPCGHFCLCQECAENYKGGGCPLCRTGVAGWIKVFTV